MHELIELRVTDNQLSSVPDSIVGLWKLRELHLSHSSRRLDECFSDFT